MRLTHAALALTLCLGACEEVQAPPPSTCRAVQGDPTPTATQVCARFNALGCLLTDCPAAYESYRVRTSPEEFNRLTACYVRAADCDQVDQCERACGADGGAVSVGQPRDGSVDDAGDAGDAIDASGGDDVMDIDPLDAGPRDTGVRDTGPRDTGPRDTGAQDSGPDDVTVMDAALIDARATDATVMDATLSDATASDASDATPDAVGADVRDAAKDATADAE
ncbi:MAG: hypothetical protein R3A52_09080 [Polyangiales bacterium]